MQSPAAPSSVWRKVSSSLLISERRSIDTGGLLEASGCGLRRNQGLIGVPAHGVLGDGFALCAPEPRRPAEAASLARHALQAQRRNLIGLEREARLEVVVLPRGEAQQAVQRVEARGRGEELLIAAPV